MNETLARKVTESLYTTIKESCSPKGNGDEEVAACCPEHGVDDHFQVNRLTAMPGHGPAAAKIEKKLEVRSNIEGKRATEDATDHVFLFSHPPKMEARPSSRQLHITPLLTATLPYSVRVSV